jgi:hypothetical protein
MRSWLFIHVLNIYDSTGAVLATWGFLGQRTEMEPDRVVELRVRQLYGNLLIQVQLFGFYATFVFSSYYRGCH